MSPSPRRPTLAERLQRQWLSGGPLSLALLPLSWLYGALLGLRALAYRCGWLRPGSLPVPVIVVGNWVVGGAGKTPATLALLALLQRRGLRVGVVSRGYGRSANDVRLVQRTSPASAVGDEPLLIHLRSGAPVAVGRDRVAAARALLAAHPQLQLLISDDGLQHLRLPRDLSLLVLDERGVGNGRLLPAGPLREPPRWCSDPTRLVIYNAAQPSTRLTGYMGQRRLTGALPLAHWWAGQAAPAGSLAGLQSLRGGPGWVAAAGLARPQRFFDMLAESGIEAIGLALPDHFDFASLPWPADCPGVLLTEKDAIKLRPERVGSVPVWVLRLDFELEPAVEAALDLQLQRLLNDDDGSPPDRDAGLPPVQGAAGDASRG